MERRHAELRAELPRSGDAGQRQELSDRPRQRRRLHRHAGRFTLNIFTVGHRQISDIIPLCTHILTNRDTKRPRCLKI